MDTVRNTKAIPAIQPKHFVYVTIIGFLIRVLLFPVVSGDYRDFLHPWFDQIQSLNGFGAIGHPIGDYLPSYIYILAFLTYLPINSLYSIKIVSCLGDILLAVYSYKTALLLTKNHKVSFLVYSLVYLLPTVMLNSAAWGQCDSLYTCALLASTYYFISEKPNKGMLCFALAFVFKLQAVFLAPFLGLLLFKKRCKIRHFLYIPLVYLAAVLPAALAGRSWGDLLTIYCRLAGTYNKLSLNAPNFYAFISTQSSRLISIAGITLCAAILLAGLIYFLQKPIPSGTYLFALAFLSVLAVPFLLPHMHERYFYVADVFSTLYVFLVPRRWYVAAAVVTSSFCACGIFLFGFPKLFAPVCSFLILVALVVVVHDTVKMQTHLKNKIII